jgi:hypothetical protein
LPLASGIFGYPAGITGIDAFPFGFPQGRLLSGKREPTSTPISTYFFIATVVYVCLST